MHKQINTINEQIKYSNTYNVFIKIYKFKNTNKEWANAEINKNAKEAFTKGNTIYTFSSQGNLLQEVKLYNGIVRCFATVNSYRVLYNYFPISELGVNDERELINILASKNVNFLNRLNFINTRGILEDITILGRNEEKSQCRVINTYESFIDYTTENSLSLNKQSNTPFFNDFIKSLLINKLQNKHNDEYGIDLRNVNNLYSFTYINLVNIIIITSYAPRSANFF